MTPQLHRFCAVIATLCVATFFISTLTVELLGSTESVQLVKSLILFPGLLILIPAIAVTGATGAIMSKQCKGKIIERKKKRMPFIALNGLVILVPAAYFLDHWAGSGEFDTQFYCVQVLELIAGAINLTLMSLNIRDGRKFRPNNVQNQTNGI